MKDKMKARVKNTGAIIEVIPCSGFDEYDFYEPETKLPWFKSELDFEVTNKDEIYNKGWADGWDEAVKSEIPKIHPKLKNSDPDYWEKLLHQYAGMAMQGILTNPIGFENIRSRGRNIQVETALLASGFAHALVEKMKQEREG